MKKFPNDLKLAGRHYARASYMAIDATFTGYKRTTAEKARVDSKSIQENADNIWFDDNNLPGPNCRHGWIVRWKSNGAIPFGDMLLDLCECGYITEADLNASCDLREAETNTFWADYGGLASKKSAAERQDAVNRSFDNRVQYDGVK